MSGGGWRGGTEPPPSVFPCRPPVFPPSLLRVSRRVPPCPPHRVPRPLVGPGQRRGAGEPPAAGRPSPGWARVAAAQDGGGCLGGARVPGAGRPAGAGLSRRVPGGARRDLPLPGFCRWVSAGAASVSPGVGVLERLRGLLPRGPSSLQKARECWGVFFTTFGFYLFLMTASG